MARRFNFQGQKEVLVKWKGYPGQDSWEPAENVEYKDSDDNEDDDSDVEDVERIVGERRLQPSAPVEYLLLWKSGEQTWEPLEHLGFGRDAMLTQWFRTRSK